MKQRLFISLDLPKEITEEVAKIQKQIIKQEAIEGKFTHVEDIHLTLKFLGHIEEEKIPQIISRLEKIKLATFEADLGKIGFFDNRIIWVELLGEKVLDLQKEIDESVKGFATKEERFMSHITIARIKKIDRSRLDLKKVKYTNIKTQLNSFSLMRSILSRKGAKYEIVKTFN